MELIDYLRMLVRRWRLLVACTLLGLVLAGAWVTVTPRVYESSALLFVGNAASGTAGNSSNALSASRFTLERMDSYAALVDSPQVTRGVRDQLRLDAEPREIGSALSADVLGKTVVLSVTARDARPDVAASIANVAAARLGAVIQLVEAPGTGAPSAIKVTVTRPASAPGSPVSPNVRLWLALGLVAGLGLGLLAAALRDQALTHRGGAAASRPSPAPAAEAGAGPSGDTPLEAGSPEPATAAPGTDGPVAVEPGPGAPGPVAVHQAAPRTVAPEGSWRRRRATHGAASETSAPVGREHERALWAGPGGASGERGARPADPSSSPRDEQQTGPVEDDPVIAGGRS